MQAHRVFISYSRRDYYFAESLAFHLEKHGVDAWLDAKDLVPGQEWERALNDALDDAETILVVASPAALGSGHVRAEWQRALDGHKRVVLLDWAFLRRLPAALEAHARVDFRGAFAPALVRLLAVLNGPSPASRTQASVLPRLPPAVWGVLLALVVPIGGYALAVYPSTTLDDPELHDLGLGRFLQGITLVAFALTLVWWLCLSLIQRRMGMTRLLLCLAFVATPFVWPLWVLARQGPAGLEGWPPEVARLIAAHWPALAGIAAVPIAGMAILLLARPEDLLRWMPTGKGWQAYRTGRVSRVSRALAPARNPFDGIGAFRIVHEPEDRPAAERLGAIIEAEGGTPEPAAQGTDAVTSVVLLTNRTRVGWLQANARTLPGRVLTVVATAMAVPEAPQWLWRRQWIDFRRWSAGHEGREGRLPSIPETVQTSRLPGEVSLLHRLWCAYAALLFVLGGVVTPEETASADTLTLTELVGVATSVLGLFTAYAASRLARRTLCARRARRWLAASTAAGCLLGSASLWVLHGLYGPGTELAAGLAGVILLPGLVWRAFLRTGFWYPLCPQREAADRGGGTGPHARLGPPRSWHTFLTVAVLALVWMLLINREL